MGTTAAIGSSKTAIELPTFAVLSTLFCGLELPPILMAHFCYYIAKFDGVPSELPPLGSSDGTLFTVVELQTLAVLIGLFQPVAEMCH